MLDLALQATVVVFMVASLGAVGLAVAPLDALSPLKDLRFVLLTLVMSWLVTPAVALLLLQAISIERPYATGLLLLALAPCAPFAPAMMRHARADPAYAAAFMLLSAVVTAAVMPLGVTVLAPGAAASAAAVARPLALFIVVPMLLGTAARGVWPRVAVRMEPVVSAIARTATFALLALTVVLYGHGVLDAVGSHAILAQLVFVALVTLAADFAGAILSAPHRSVVTIGLSTRNLGAALAPLAAIEDDPRAIVMIVIAGPITFGAAALTARFLAVRARRYRPSVA